VGQLVLAVLFLGGWIADMLFLRLAPSLAMYAPDAVRLAVGLVLLAPAGALAWTSHRTIFGEQREKPHVIRRSVFALVRHPMYLSEILVYLGLLILQPSIIAGGVWLLAIGFLHWIARREERLLLGRFGDEYEKYMRDVPMWIPFLRRK